MIVLLASLGARSALPVGFAIPTSFLLCFLLLAAILGALADNMTAIGIANAGLLVIAVHVLMAVHVADLPWHRLLVLARVPGYLAWKLLLLGRIAVTARKDSAWIRTARNHR